MSAIETHAANNSRNGESTDRVVSIQYFHLLQFLKFSFNDELLIESNLGNIASSSNRRHNWATNCLAEETYVHQSGQVNEQYTLKKEKNSK